MTREMIIEQLERHRQEFALDHGWNASVLESLDAAIKVLKQESCEDCISRQRAIDTFGLSEKSRKYGGDHSGYDTIMLYEVQDALKALPSVQPEQKMGKWIIVDDCEQFIAKCSECGRIEDSRMISKYPYCHCGAKMESEETK